jgi:hypothetical protein
VLTQAPVTYDGRPATGLEAVRALYTFRVLEGFKGAGATEYQLLGDLPVPPPTDDGVVTINGDAWPLNVGQRYLIFGWGDDPATIDSCSSSALGQAKRALKQLRKLRSGQPSSGSASSSGGPTTR